jgi:hypothetical protein
MNTDREFDIAVADIDAANTRLIQEYLRSRRRKWDKSVAGLPQRSPQPMMPPPEEPEQMPEEEQGYASTA